MPVIKVNNPKNVIEAHLKTNYFKLRNTGGPKGDQGPKGDTGEIAVGSTTTGAPGSNAQVTNSGTSTDAILNFTIPRGDKGDKGDTGATGAAATITVGSTTTGNPGTSASVVNAGTTSAAVLNFTIPRGAKGDTGATGATGQAATVAVGTTTTLAAGSDATVTNSGTTSAAVLNFGIPKGDKGDTGEKGDVGGVRSEYVTELPSSGQENTYYLTGDTATIGTASGNSFQVTNNDNTGQVLLTQLDGNAAQTTYSGKNLCSSTSVPVATQVYFNFDKNTITAGTYTLSTALNEATSNNTVSLVIDGTATNLGTFAGSAGATVKTTFTLSAAQITSIQGSTTSLIRLYKSGASFTNPTWAQLEAGSTATTYEPYVGGTASPNPDYPQEVKTVTGRQLIQTNNGTQKNLANPQALLDWLNKTAEVCFKNSWGNSSSRPSYISYDGRSHVLGWNADTLYTVRTTMTNPTYDEACILVDGIFEANTQYTISCDVYSGASNWKVGYSDGTNTLIPAYTGGGWGHTSLTTASGKTVTKIYLTYNGGRTRIDLDTLQIEKGTTETTFTPFQQQTQEIDLGKNLLPSINTTRTINDVTFTPQADGSIKLSGTASANATYPINVNSASVSFTEYTTAGSYYISGGSQTDNNIFVQAYFSVDGGSGQYSTSSFGAQSGQIKFGAYIRVNSGTNTDGITIYPQIEKGAYATEYAQHTTPIELAKIGTYQDYIWNDDGTWKIHKEVGKATFNGSENDWYYQDSGTLTNRFAIPVSSYGLASGAVGLCNNNEFVTSGVSVDSQRVGIVNSVLYYRIAKTVLASTQKADFQAWLASNNTIIYTALATPTDTEITDDTLLAQLNTISELYGGVNNISLVPSAGAQGTITVKYTTWDKYNRYDVYIWNDTIGDFQIIHSGGGNN